MSVSSPTRVCVPSLWHTSCPTLSGASTPKAVAESAGALLDPIDEDDHTTADALHDHVVRLARPKRCLGDSEVQNLDGGLTVAAASAEEIGRLDVPVHDTERVGIGCRDTRLQ
jgi:hypothetical protein